MNRLAQPTIHEIAMVAESSSLSSAEKERIQFLLGTLSRVLYHQRGPEGAASDNDYFAANGGLGALAGVSYLEWQSELALQESDQQPEPPRDPSPGRSLGENSAVHQAKEPSDEINDETNGPTLRPRRTATTLHQNDADDNDNDEVVEDGDVPAPSALRLSVAQNDSALSDLKTAYDSRRASLNIRDESTLNVQNESSAIMLELVQCDLFNPFLMTYLGVYDPDTPTKFHDVLVAGSELMHILQTNLEVGALAKGIVLADASNTANAEYPAAKLRAPAYDVLAILHSINDSTKLDPLFKHPLAIEARDATNKLLGKGGKKSKAWMKTSKLKGACKIQFALVGNLMVQIKTLMLISVDDWRAKFPGRADFFKRLEAMCSATTGKPFLSLRITELIEETLVKGASMELSPEHERVRLEAWTNIAEDFTGKTWLPQYAIAEADPLELKNYDEPWTPPDVPQPVLRPFLSKDSQSTNVIRRSAVRSVVFTQRSLRVADVLMESGYPEERYLHLALAVLCLATSDLGNTQAYNFLMDDDAAIRAKATEYLRLPAPDDRSDKGGAVIKMLTTLDAKMETFRVHHVFVNLSDDVRNGTTSTLDRLSAYFERLAELAASEEESEDDESIGGEE